MTAHDLELEQQGDGISLSTLVIMELIEAVHEKGASFRFQANGYSMTPAIRNGDHTTLAPLGNLIPGRGDVLAFRHPERPQMVVHRVIRKRKNSLYLWGDNAPQADGWIPQENILGLIIRVERQGKARFWPNRSEPHFWSTIYLFFYPFWPPVRRQLVPIWRRLRKAMGLGK